MEVQELLAKYFSGNTTIDEATQIEQWRNESPENELEYIEFKQAWSYTNVDRFKPAPALKNVFGDIDKLENQKVEPKVIKLNWRIAASVAILLVAGYFIYNAISNRSTSEVTGEIALFENVFDEKLEDGSLLVLSKGASFEYISNFRKDNTREIKLNGKAYFDIERNEEKPFIIRTANATIRVLGTSFQVRADEGQTEIVVESGLVTISKNGLAGAVELRPGEMGIISDSGNEIVKKKNANSNYLAWRTGVLYFNNSSLVDVADLLNDVYDIKLKFDNQALKDCKLTATFKNRSGKEILDIIEKTFQVEIEQKGKQYIVKGNGC